MRECRQIKLLNRLIGSPIMAVLLFNSAWLITVRLNELISGYWYALVAVILTYFFNTVSKKNQRCKVGAFVIVVSGLLTDYALSSLGLIEFYSGSYLPGWLVFLWFLFGISFHKCFSWMKSISIFYAGLIGGIAGPVSYWIASSISPVNILSPTVFTILNSAFYFFLFLICHRNYLSFQNK